MDSSEIEMVEIVCLSVGSFPVSTSGQTVFLERLVPTVAKTVFIRFAFSSSRTARVLYSRLIGPIWGLLFGYVASESTFKYAAVDFAESVFSRKKLVLAHVLSCYFISDLFVLSPGCYVLGAHGGRKELVPIIHLSSYFVSYPWVHLLRIFIFLKATCLSHTSLNIKLHAHCISSLSSNRSETWNGAHETSAWNYLALTCLK